MKIECSEDIEKAFNQAQRQMDLEAARIMNPLSISELTIENGMRLLAKAGRRIDAAFCGKIVKRQFVIRDEILNPKKETE